MSDLLSIVQDTLESQEEWVKAEFCLLASLINPRHPAVQDLTFNVEIYQAAAAVFLPHRYATTWDALGFDTSLEKDYLLAKLRGHPMPKIHGSTAALVLAHQVFFATDFGRTPVVASISVSRQLLKAIGSHENPDWVGECLLALKCLRYPIPSKYRAFVERWNREASFNWKDYHAFLTYAIYQAI